MHEVILQVANVRHIFIDLCCRAFIIHRFPRSSHPFCVCRPSLVSGGPGASDGGGAGRPEVAAALTDALAGRERGKASIVGGG
jgi:hypothetical protein